MTDFQEGNSCKKQPSNRCLQFLLYKKVPKLQLLFSKPHAKFQLFQAHFIDFFALLFYSFTHSTSKPFVLLLWEPDRVYNCLWKFTYWHVFAVKWAAKKVGAKTAFPSLLQISYTSAPELPEVCHTKVTKPRLAPSLFSSLCLDSKHKWFLCHHDTNS